jgi:hypothetical protein
MSGFNDRHSLRNREIEELGRMISYFSQKSDQYAEYDSVCQKMDRIAKGKRCALLVWGIIITVLGLICTLAYTASQESVASLLYALLLVALPGIGMIIGYIFYSRSFDKNTTIITNRYYELSEELYQHYLSYGICLIGPEYTNPSNLQTILSTIQSGRADTTKDALNVLVEDSYRNNMQKLAAQTARSAAAAARGAKTSAVFSAANFFLK